MSKTTALTDNCYVGGTDISGDVGSLSSVSSPRAIIDVSSLVVPGYERLLGRSDGMISFNAFYEPTVEHAALSPVGTAAGTTNTQITYAHGVLVSNDAASLQAKQIDYAFTIGVDYSIGIAVQTQAGSGFPLEWGQMLTTGKQTFASAGTVAGTVDGQTYTGGTATAFGAAAYLHAFSIASGTATVAVQDSADGASFSNVTGLVFTAVSGSTFERVATTKTQAIRRYWRINVTGTFTNLVAFANLVVYPTSQT